jgi:uncharacterized protein (TIGR02271 family)
MDNLTIQSALVAIFPERATADRAVQELVRNGFDANQVEVSSTDDIARHVAAGNAGLSGTRHDSSGGGIAGFFHRLFGTETNEDDRTYYTNAVKRGKAAVVVHADDDSLNRAADVLNRNGAIEVETDREARRDIPGDVSRDISGDQAIPVVREELQVGKRIVQRGAVRIYSRLMQQPVEETIDLREERVRVDRRSADRPATSADIAAADREVIEVVETVEEPVISKRARVVEEVIIDRDVNERTETVRDNVMHSEVHVEDSRRGELGSTAARQGSTAASQFDSDFQRDFQTRYGSDPNLRFDDYAPAYTYGYDMACDPRYSGRSFDEASEELRTDYMQRNPNSVWDRMVGAIRYGWEKVTGKRKPSQFDSDFQRDFQTRYSSDPNLRYDDYAPAYTYGYDMASDPRYSGRSFDEASEELRTDYMRRNPNSVWDRMVGAIRYGWEKVTGKRKA